MEALPAKIVGTVSFVIIMVVLLARSEAFNSIIKESGSTTIAFMKAAAGE